MLFVIPSTNVVKLIGFTKDDDLIVEVDRGRMLHLLQVYDRTSQEFHNVGISADGVQFNAVQRHILLNCIFLSFGLTCSSIKYALTVNPNIYVSCIKQFWTTVAVKQVNDVTRLQALIDKKKVVVTEATIQEALCLDDAEGVDCLPNEEILAELARMGYEKPSTKLTFYKAFFSSQW
nr:F-box domain-containing protein [Tanacetum cinerariifolium]